MGIFAAPGRNRRKGLFVYSIFTVRKRRALRITETELKLIAAAAIIGFSRMPQKGLQDACCPPVHPGRCRQRSLQKE